MVLGIVAGLCSLELLARLGAPGDVHLRIHAAGGGAGVQLQPHATAVGRLRSGRSYRVRIDGAGLREPSPAGARWMLVGDSGAFGVGVEGEQSLAAWMTGVGRPTVNAGIPAFTVPDALAHAEALAPSLGIDRFVVLVNPADDHLEPDQTARKRFEVVDGWLVSRSSPGWVRWLLGSPLGDLRLVTGTLSRVNAMRARATTAERHWSELPDLGRDRFVQVGRAIRAFARDDTRQVCVVWMPLDATLAPTRDAPSLLARPHRPLDDAAALRGLRTGLGSLPLVVPRPSDPATWLPGDVHLSASGLEHLAGDVIEGCALRE